MQLLNSWHYKRGLQRCQVKWRVRDRFFLFTGTESDTLFSFDSMLNEVNSIDDPVFYFSCNNTVTVQIVKDIYAFRKHKRDSPMEVFKYEISNGAKPVKRFLARHNDDGSW